MIWRDIKESLLERNVLHVIIVSCNFFKLVIWRDIKESFLEGNVLHVIIVLSNFLLVIWSKISNHYWTITGSYILQLQLVLETWTVAHTLGGSIEAFLENFVWVWLEHKIHHWKPLWKIQWNWKKTPKLLYENSVKLKKNTEFNYKIGLNTEFIDI